MAKRTLTLALCAFFSAGAMSGRAPAQEVIGDPASPAVVDPAAVLEGLWRIDQAEVGTAEDSAIGKVIRIDRTAVASLSRGTCANPTFTATGVQTIEIRCLGEVLATVEAEGAAPDTVRWIEPNIDIVLHRIAPAAVAPAASSSETGGASDEDSDEGSEESE